MDYYFGIKYIKLRKRYNVCRIYIAAIINITNVEYPKIKSVFDIGSYKCSYNTLLRPVIIKYTSLEPVFVDLETGMVYCDTSQMCVPKKHEKYIISSSAVPLSSFLNIKYKYKTLSCEEILETTNNLINDIINRHANDDSVNIPDYNKIYIASVYNSDNIIIKEKALVYLIDNKYIDLESKEVYLDDKSKIKKEFTSKFIKSDELIPIDRYLNNNDISNNKIKKRRRLN